MYCCGSPAALQVKSFTVPAVADKMVLNFNMKSNSLSDFATMLAGVIVRSPLKSSEPARHEV
jgi:hypothetical protein